MNVKTLLKKLLVRPPASIIGLDVGSGSIKAVEISKQQDTYCVNAVNIVDIPDCNELLGANSLYISLYKLLTTTKFRSKHVVAALGGRATVTRQITLPKMEPDELAQAIKWDADKYVPYDPGTYYYDYAIIESSANTKGLSVLLVATPKKAVDMLINVCKRLNLYLQAIDIEAMAIYRTLAQKDNVIVVDIGANVSTIIIYANGAPVVSRSIAVTGTSFTEAIMQDRKLDAVEAERLKTDSRMLLPPVDKITDDSLVHSRLLLLVNELSREIRRTIEYSQIQVKGFRPEQIYLTGGGATMVNLPGHIAAQIGIPTIVHNPFAQVQTDIHVDPDWLERVTHQLAVAIGLGMRGDEL